MIIFDHAILNISEWILNLFLLGTGLFFLIFSTITLVMFILWLTNGGKK